MRERLEAYPGRAGVRRRARQACSAGLAAVPGAKRARVLLRREDIAHKRHLKAAAPDVELSFAEGFFDLGGLIIEFPESTAAPTSPSTRRWTTWPAGSPR